jgi:ABC-type multidrug transport system fused ATPase/permease subunit
LLFSNKASACFLFKLSRLEKERLILRLLLMLFSSLIKVFLELLFSLLSDIAFGSFSFLSDVIFVLIFELAFLSLFARVTAKNFSESEEFW